jgi:hypothetical protein
MELERALEVASDEADLVTKPRITDWVERRIDAAQAQAGVSEVVASKLAELVRAKLSSGPVPASEVTKAAGELLAALDREVNHDH